MNNAESESSARHKASVIVVSYNTSDLLKACLRSVAEAENKCEIEIVVVDNASADDSVAMVRDDFPQVKLIASDVNLGFAAANNLAYAETDGDFVFLLNPDARLKDGSLDAMIEFMNDNPRCGIAGGLIRNPDGGLEPSARRFPGVMNKFLIMTGLSDRFPESRIFGRADYKFFEHDRPLQVDWVPGTFTALRRTMLDEIGFFDNRFFMYFEETDLCLRARRNGWQAYFVPFAEIVHEGGACSKTRKDLDFDTGGSQLLGYRLRSEALYYRKNFGYFKALAALGLEGGWHLCRALANFGGSADKQNKRRYSKMMTGNIIKAWRDTKRGLHSPPTPW